MVKLELLSKNLVLMLETLLTNDNIGKYLYYDLKNPLSQPSVSNVQSLLFSKIFPYPFDPSVTTNACSQIRVYYTDGDINDVVVERISITFDVVVAKSLWLTNDGSPTIRPYEIIKEIVNTFDNKSIDTVGKLEFDSFRHVMLNDTFDIVQLTAEMVSYSTGS